MTIDELLGMLSAPAQRALQPLRLKAVEDLARHSRAEIAALHGIGPRALEVLERELGRCKLGFKGEAAKPGAGARRPAAAAGQTESGEDPIEAYIRGFPPATQKVLQRMRALIRAAAPEATEKISYQMPTFYLNGNLVHFAGFQKHVGLYPLPHALESFKEELKSYTTGKGSIQFPLDRSLPEALITRIVKQRVRDNLSKPAKSAKKAKG